jgi:hypothetical protein
MTVRPNGPCAQCPYRRDCPSGVWDKSEYDKLRKYDGTIAQQAMAGAHQVFMCHQSDGRICAGWAGCHDMRETLAMRLHWLSVEGSVFTYESPVPLFASGAEAADHGQREIDAPGIEAEAAIEKIVKVREARGNPVKFKEDVVYEGLLRSYENGPRIWDAVAVLPGVYELEDRGLIEPVGCSGAYQLTGAGRKALRNSSQL